MNAIPRILSIVPVLSLLGGCGLFPPTLVEQGIVEVDIPFTRPVSVYNVNVYRDDDETVIRGVARFQNAMRHGFFSGHIDIDLMLPNGQIAISRDVRLTLRNGRRQHGREATFVSRFDVNPSRGTTARVQYHDGAHNGT